MAELLPTHTIWTHRNATAPNSSSTRRLKRPMGASNQLVFAVRNVSSTPSDRKIVRIDSRWYNRTGLAINPAFRAKAKLFELLLRVCELRGLYTSPSIIERLNVTFPDGSGRTVSERQFVLLDEAHGTSFAAFRRLREPTQLPAIDGAAIRDTAVFDTLINARDRSYENVYISQATGALTMIDTLSGALEYNAGPVDSVMIPASKLFHKRDLDPLQKHHRRLWDVDYRCFALPSMAIGRAYSPRLHRCLVRIAGGDAFDSKPLPSSAQEVSIVDCAPRQCRRPYPRFQRSALVCESCRAIGEVMNHSISTANCSYAPTKLCIPAELRERARSLLDIGFEATLSKLLVGSRWGGRGSTRFDRRSSPRCNHSQNPDGVLLLAVGGASSASHLQPSRMPVHGGYGI